MDFYTIGIITLLNVLFFVRAHCEACVEQGSPDSACSDDIYRDEETLKQEKMKYYIQKAQEYHAAHTDNNNPSEEMTNEELKQILRGFIDKTIDIENVDGDTKSLNSAIEDINSDITEMDIESDNLEDSYDEQKQTTFEFPKLTVVNPGTVGDVVELEIEEGQVYKMITRSIRPPVYEIPNFLSDEECDYVIDTAKQNGLNVSNLFGADVEEEFEEDLDLSEISRVSEQTWLSEESLGSKFWRKLQQRLAKLTGLPLGLIQRGEPIQVVSYVAGGHYHAHLDTVDDADELPCCFQTHCGDKEFKPEWAECCRLCRFATVLYYLNEPEEGGETAFPLADMPEELFEEKFDNVDEQEWYNLSHYCHNSSLVVTPKRGTAVLWYNHFIDEQTGYLGKVDRRSHHGGCDLIKGSKWIANNWIAGTTYDDRFKPSMFYDDDS